jgi:hypothetical protein
VSIYHLHIPRTSGIYIKNNVIPHLISNGVEHCISNRNKIDVEKIKKSRFVGGHFGLMPLDYMDSPEIFTIVRDPVERFISYFKYTTGPIRAGKEAEEKLDRWLYGEECEMQSNLQSKFLTGKLNIEKFNQDILQFQNTVSSGWYLEGYKLDIKNVISSLEKMKAYTLEELDLFKIDLNKSLLKQFGFSTFKHSDKANSSYDIGIKFDKRHINRIQEINLLDMEVYEYVQKIKKEY